MYNPLCQALVGLLDSLPPKIAVFTVWGAIGMLQKACEERGGLSDPRGSG